MNILIEQLPEAVKIGSQVVPINTDFRDCLRVILAFEDPDLTGFEKRMILIDNLYPEPPDDLEAAFNQGVKFLNGGQANEEKEEVPLRLFSFEKDANLIFAAFQQTHGIDLNHTEYLHWWQFLALFMDLGSETAFCQLIGLRKRVKSGTATKEEQKAAKEMGDMFEVPEPEEPLTPEEREKIEIFDRALRLGK